MKLRTWLGVISCLILVGCGDEHNYAPVSDIHDFDAVPHAGAHTVQAGETLYEIAWRYGLDYRSLAKLNHIKPPYAIVPGQKIYVRGLETKSKTVSPQVSTHAAPQEFYFSSTRWLWPAKGPIITPFSTQNKGVNIAGELGEPILATANAKVVYAGDGLRGYGKLIILKHNSLYFSAYAHCNQLFVHEGEKVKKGQKIAEMGKTGTDKVMLHFEIRKAGKPINPLSLYQKKS
jgi:lipoprotein NlpD